MQKMQLTIPEPCHENWQQMTPTQQGRFCHACAKEVVDFSMMTDTEVLNYFTTLTHEKVCGRALPSQLNRTISRPKEPKKRLFWYWNYIVVFFMLFSKSHAIKAQGQMKPVTERSPVKFSENYKDQVNVMGQTKTGSRVITGKVTDVDGNAVSFASIRIKGTDTGISADAVGMYSIRVKNKDVLVITGASYKQTEVSVESRNEINIVLETLRGVFAGEVILVSRYGRNGYYGDYDVSKNVAVIQVKDDKSGLPVPKAKIVIAKGNVHDTVIADKNGNYKLKGIKTRDDYYLKVDSEGYTPVEFSISATDFKERKKIWQVSLTKLKTSLEKSVTGAQVRASADFHKGKETVVRLGSISAVSIAKAPLYVVDGTVVPNGNEINPDDIEDISVLQGPAAMALFGTDASNGAILITTRKAKVKTMDTVAIKANVDYSAKGLMGAVIPGIRITTYADLKARVSTLFADSLKIFPNPVPRGNAFSLALKLKQTGSHYIQVTDAAGTIVLQKQVHALVKEYKETMPADARWGAGVYHIRVFDNKNKLISKSSFIVR